MNKLIKRTALASLLIAGGAFSQASLAETAPSNAVANEARPVAAFTAIELAGPYNVVIKDDGGRAVEVRGTRKQLDNLETIVQNGTLIVRPVKRNGFSFQFGKTAEAPTVRISAAGLKSLVAGGSGDVRADMIKGQQFALTASGSGDVEASGAVGNLVVRAGGSVTLGGSSKEIRAELTGSGDLEACGLAVENASAMLRSSGNACIAGNIKKFDAEVHGSGDLSARGLASNNVRVILDSSGSVELSGTSNTLSAEVNGSGDLDAKGLVVARAVTRNRGPGNIFLKKVSDSLDAEVRGSGELKTTAECKDVKLTMSGPGQVHLDGNTANLNARLSGSGNLQARGLVAKQADVVVRGPGSAWVHVQGKLNTEGKQSGAEGSRMVLIDRSGVRPSRDN
eukprot:gene22492-25487_t